MSQDILIPWFISYGLVLGTSAALNTVFILYSVELFTHYTLSNVTSFWFYAGQTMYMVWNSFNDPIFGWFSDKQGIRRTQAIRYGGIVWGISFLLIWWPWSKVLYDVPNDYTSSSRRSSTTPEDYGGTTTSGGYDTPSSSYHTLSSFTWFHILAGIHFTLTTCLYDSALTYVELNHSALLSEAITDESTRAKANAYGAIFASFGTLTSFLAHSTWNMYNLTMYRMFVLGLTVISILLFHIAARGLEQQQHQGTGSSRNSSKTTSNFSSSSSSSLTSSSLSINNHTNITETIPSVVALDNETSTLIHRRHGEEPHYSRDDDTMIITVNQPTEFSSSPSSSSPSASPSEVHRYSLSSLDTVSSSSSSSVSRYQSYWVFLRQILQQRNVVIFMIIGALQSFDCRFEKSFFSPFMTILTFHHSDDSSTVTTTTTISTPTDLSSNYFHNLQGLALSLSFILPHIITLLVTPYIPLYGIATVIETIFFIRIFLITLAIIIGYQYSSLFIILFMLLNRIMSEAICRLSPLIGADIVDEDLYLQFHPSHHPHQGITVEKNTIPPSAVSSAATLLGTLAFTSRIAQSLAPMLGYTFLPDKNTQSYADTNHLYNDKGTNPLHQQSVVVLGTRSSGGDEGLSNILQGITSHEQQTVWNLLVYVPFLTVLLQLLFWRKYSLYGTYLKMIKTWIVDYRREI